MMTNRLTHVFLLALAALAGACTVTDTQPPPLAGPSEMSLSLSITANPDVLSLDGASQSQIVVEARDANGQPAANVALRLEILADGQFVDYGTLSARTLVTGSNGRAAFTYTAPSSVGGEIPALQISVTPTGTDASAQVRRVVEIRLVPPGIILIGPSPRFTFAPTDPAAFTSVRFDGSTSTAGIGAFLVGYLWDFGDNTSATGVTASHQYDSPGAYRATLTVTDNNGLANRSAGQTVTVGAGDPPTAVFVFSPTTPAVGQSVSFNGRASTPGLGHRIVSYRWDLGNNTQRSGSTVSASYATAGTYRVVLTVTDEVGQTDQSDAQSVTVGPADRPTAVITYSPTDPAPGDPVIFDGRDSTAPAGSTIPDTSYVWDFGDPQAGPGNPGTATGATATHTYTNAGTYTVRLTVTTNGTPRTATITAEVPVVVPALR